VVGAETHVGTGAAEQRYVHCGEMCRVDGCALRSEQPGRGEQFGGGAAVAGLARFVLGPLLGEVHVHRPVAGQLSHGP